MAEHCYSEFERVQKGAEAWRNGDIEEYGRLSFESGRSTIENCQTGSEELVKIYEIMLKTLRIYRVGLAEQDLRIAGWL